MFESLDPSRLAAAATTLLAYLTMCGAIWRGRHLQRRAQLRAAAALAPGTAAGEAVLVAHGSQTGTAEQLAWQTARALHTAGVPARILPLAQLGAAELAGARRALFIVSTYGEGDGPDAAALFARRVMSGQPALHGLHAAVLALGDSTYRNFCGYGRRLDAWLQACGAMPLQPRIEVDNGDPAALQQWQHAIARLAGTSDLPDWEDAAPFQPWRLLRRDHLNPGSAGGPCFHLELAPPEGSTLPGWQAGDLAQVLAPGDPQRPREYSIASLPSDGSLQLLVRQERHADGGLGLASGWLTGQLAAGGEVPLRLREHRNFRLGENAARPLILIGNGTGLAGLRSHLKARAAAGHGDNWLVYGERSAAHDAYYRDELQAWQAAGLLARADFAWSRDQPEKRYVQHLLRDQAAALQDWVARGAAIYVCGSLQGMAAGVEAALDQALGSAAVERLVEEGRLRRDVY